MAVKLQFGQEVAERDAKERAGGECQCTCDPPLLTGCARAEWIGYQAEIKHEDPDGNREREESVDCMPPRQVPTAASHEHADCHRVEWFVQNDYQERAETGEPGPACFALNGRCKRNAVQHAVERQAQRGATPG